MRNRLLICVLFLWAFSVWGTAVTLTIPIAQWKMDSTEVYSGDRMMVRSEIDSSHRFVLGESAGPYPVLTADGDGISGLAGDKAVNFLNTPARAYCNEFRLENLGYSGNLDMAFEVYLKPGSDVTTSQTVVYAANKWEFRINGGTLIFYVWPDGKSVRTAIIPNEWNHVYAECVGQELLLTIDGATVTATEPGINGIIVDATRLYTGATTGGTRPYTGLMDELTIYEAVPAVCGDWGYAPGDFNKDCYVNLEDFCIFASHWLASN